MNEQLKPFQQVLVRADGIGSWMCDFYSHYDSETEYHICVGGRFECCIPYEGNEALLGTTDSPKPKRWRADNGKKYYCVTSFFDIGEGVEHNNAIDNRNYANGNYFRTKEEAEEWAFKLKTMLQDKKEK